MEQAGHEIWLKDALVFFVAAGLIVPLLKALRMPSVLGYLLAGIVLGPQGISSVASEWMPFGVLTISEPEAAARLAELGVLFLLFLVGLELSFSKLWALRMSVFGTGSLQIGASTIVIGSVVYGLGLPVSAALIIGLALSLSSTAIVVQLLREQHRTTTPAGRVTLAVLLFQDVLVAPILIAIGLIATTANDQIATVIGAATIKAIVTLAGLLIASWLLLERLLRFVALIGGRDFLIGATLLVIIAASVLTASVGLSMALGAFVAGLLIGGTEFKHQIEVDFDPFKGLLLGLFFMTVGMSLEIRAIAGSLPLVGTGLCALLLIKFAMAAFACRVVTANAPVWLESAFLLAPAGEFAFVVISASLTAGLIPREQATIVTAIVGLSMTVTPLLAYLGRTVAQRLTDARVDQADSTSEMAGHVVIAGFGRVGQIVARILKEEGGQIVGLDVDPDHVAKATKEGWQVYLGDASRREILEHVGLARAAFVVITVDSASDAERIVTATKEIKADISILARARHADHAKALMLAGADFVIPDAVEAGLQLADRALQELGYNADSARDRIAADRDAEYRIGLNSNDGQSRQA